MASASSHIAFEVRSENSRICYNDTHVSLPSTVTINCYITLSTGYSACIGHNPYPDMASLAVSYDTYGVFTQVTCSELLFPFWFSHLSWKAHNPWWELHTLKYFPDCRRLDNVVSCASLLFVMELNLLC